MIVRTRASAPVPCDVARLSRRISSSHPADHRRCGFVASPAVRPASGWRWRAEGQNGAGVAYQHRFALARPPTARRDCNPGQFPDGQPGCADQELRRPEIRPSRTCREVRLCRRRQERHFSTLRRAQVSRRLAITPEDVKWSYEHYQGASASVLHNQTEAVDIVDDRTIKFSFKEPFLDFPILMGTANVCGAGWVVPEKYYQKVGKDGFLHKPIGAGPYKLVPRRPAINSSMRPSKTTTARCTSRASRSSACPRRQPAWRW